MPDFSAILSQIGRVAEELLPAVVPGAGAALKAAEAIGQAFTSVKELNGGDAPHDAEAQHKRLFERVKAHAESTFDRLEGR